MAVQDALVTLQHNRYGEYLEHVYTKMAAHVPPDADIIEIGARHDRGVISKRVIPHKWFMAVDRNRRRGDLCIDVLETPLKAGVILSTCVLHHTPECDIPRLLDNLKAPLLMFSGPNAQVMTELFGDHQWHIDTDKLTGWLTERGYTSTWERIGLSELLCEVLIVARACAWPSGAVKHNSIDH